MDIQECRGGYLIGGWAVGGLVCSYFKLLKFEAHLNIIVFYIQDFVFPEGVALPVGGEGTRKYLVIEQHYDNPMLVSGMIL